MIFKHILVSYDGSEPSVKALNKAVELAKTDSSIKLSVAHVINLQPVIVGDMTFSQPESYQEQVQEQGNAIIDQVKTIIHELPHANVIILAGTPAEAVLNFAESNDCDLIMMGSRGLSAIKEWMLGSVSHNIVQHSRIPVLIVK
jgi:nucleotide-binding universal stress UspA family protein